MEEPQEGECISVQFDGDGGLGLNFTPPLWPRIESIDPDSPAAATELVAGMCLVEVQGNDMVGKTLAEAGAAFAEAGRPLRLTFQVPVPTRADEAKARADEASQAAAEMGAQASAAASAVSANATSLMGSWATSLSKKAEEARVAAEAMYAQNLAERERRAEEAEAEAEAEQRAQAAEAAAVAAIGGGTVSIGTSEGVVIVESPQKPERPGAEQAGAEQAGAGAGAGAEEQEQQEQQQAAPSESKRASLEEGEPPPPPTDDKDAAHAPGALAPSEPEPDSGAAIAAADGSSSESTALVEELQRQLAEQQASTASVVAEKQARIDALEKKATAAAADERRATDSLEQSWAEEGKKDEQLFALEQRLQQETDALAAKTTEAEGLRTELETTTSGLDVARADLGKAKAELKDKKSVMIKQGKAIKKLEEQTDGLTKMLDASKAETEGLRKDLEAAQEQMADMEEQQAMLRSTNAALEAQVAGLEAARAELESKRDDLTASNLTVTADIQTFLDKNKIDQEELRAYCQHVEDLRVKLVDAKISTLLRTEEAKHLDPEDIYQKSCAKLSTLRAEIKRRRKKLEAEPESKKTSVTLGVTPFLLLTLMDDTVDMRERLNDYEWHKQQDAYRREQELQAEHSQEGARRTHLSQQAVKQLKQHTQVGYLYKRGEHNTSWKKRYFELKNFQLKYFASPGDDQEKGSIVVTHVEVENAPADREHAHVFYLRSVDRVFILAAETEADKASWMANVTAIREIIVRDVGGGGM